MEKISHQVQKNLSKSEYRRQQKGWPRWSLFWMIFGCRGLCPSWRQNCTRHSGRMQVKCRVNLLRLVLHRPSSKKTHFIETIQSTSRYAMCAKYLLMMCFYLLVIMPYLVITTCQMLFQLKCIFYDFQLVS